MNIGSQRPTGRERNASGRIALKLMHQRLGDGAPASHAQTARCRSSSVATSALRGRRSSSPRARRRRTPQTVPRRLGARRHRGDVRRAHAGGPGGVLARSASRRAYEDAAASRDDRRASAPARSTEQGDARDRPGELRHLGIFGQLERRARRYRSPTARSPGRRTSSTPGSPPTSASAGAPGRRAGPILAADRTPLAEGPAAARAVGHRRRSPSSARSAQPSARAGERARRRTASRPAALTGISGLELAFNERLAGQPGGQLLAVSADERATSAAGACSPPATRCAARRCGRTSTPTLQQTAVTALGSLYGGAAVLDAKTGAVLALAGLALLGAPAPGLDLQDDHRHRRPRRRDRQALRRVPGRVLELGDRPRDPERARRALRRHLRETSPTRATRCSRPSGPSSAARSWSKTAELYGFNSPPALFDPAATARHRPARRARSRRPLGERRGRRVGDRPGPGAGDAAGDGDRRADDRQQGRADADPDRPRRRRSSPTESRSRSPRRRPRRR